MSYFLIKNREIQSSSESIEQLAKVIRSYDSAVNRVANNLELDGLAREMLRTSLHRVSGQIIDEAASLNSLSQALNWIALEYQKTEQALLGRDTGYEVFSEQNTSEEASSWIDLNWFKKIIEDIRYSLMIHGLAKPRKQTRTEGEPVTERQEHEMDLYMKKETEKILKESRFSEKTWRAASYEERKRILQEYLDRIYSILGLPKVTITWDNLEAENGYVNMGAYSPNDNSVHINEWVIRNGDANNFSSYELLTTVTHEMRHYYQQEAVRHPERYVVTEETISEWQDSFENYRSTEDFMEEEKMTQREAYEAYRNQAVERDARWFAGQD